MNEVNYFPVCSALEKMLSEWSWNETLLKLSLAYNVPHKHNLITFFPLLFICFNLISNCIFSTRLLSPTLSEFIRFKPSFSVTNTSSLFLCYSVILETESPSSHHSFSYSSKYFKLIPISYHTLLCLSTSHEWCIVLSAATTWVKTMTTTIWEQI